MNHVIRLRAVIRPIFCARSGGCWGFMFGPSSSAEFLLELGWCDAANISVESAVVEPFDVRDGGHIEV